MCKGGTLTPFTILAKSESIHSQYSDKISLNGGENVATKFYLEDEYMLKIAIKSSVAVYHQNSKSRLKRNDRRMER